MARSGFDYGASAPAGTRAPWVQTWTPGPALANLFNLYPSRGDVTIATATNLPAMVDGPIQVDRFGALTVNALLSGVVRNRGRFILADSLTMGAAGLISMTARGAAGSPKWANQDILIPTSITLSGQNTSYRAFIQWLAANGYAIFDPTLYACPPPGMGDVIADYATWPGRGAAIISAAGCGARVGPAYGFQAGLPGAAGMNGGVGSGATGAGSIGTAPTVGKSGSGRVWGGGSGSGGYYDSLNAQWTESADDYGGPGGSASPSGAAAGGGAGNPGGAPRSTGAAGADGTGGVLVVIVRGPVSLTSGHVLAANGAAGGAATGGGGGGGSGGGHASLIYAGALTGTPNVTASGGPGGAGNYAGGPGGVGVAQVKIFAQMGWT